MIREYNIYSQREFFIYINAYNKYIYTTQLLYSFGRVKELIM